MLGVIRDNIEGSKVVKTRTNNANVFDVLICKIFNTHQQLFWSYTMLDDHLPFTESI